MKKFNLPHLALYSKGWYKRFNPKSARKTIWDDLRCLMTADDYSGEVMSKSDIVSVILSQCERIDRPAFKLLNFVKGISENNSHCSGYYHSKSPTTNVPKNDFNQLEAIIYYCLSEIAALSRDEFETPLPRPDPKVLPLKNGTKMKSINRLFPEKEYI